MDINDLVNALKNGDNVGAESAFNGVMADRINSAMDDRKIELAQGMMGMAQEVEDTDLEEPIEDETEVGEYEDVSIDQESE